MRQEHFEAELERLGVRRWDTMPPEAGQIRFFDGSERVVAHGRFQVILSFGPDDRYTMGWAIGSYASIGIPFVSRDTAPGEAAVHPATREDAWARARTIGAGIDCDFLYWCSTLLVAISEFSEGEAVRELPLEISPASKRAVHAAACTAGNLSGAMQDAIVFVLEGSIGDIEGCRVDVGPDEVAGLIKAYWTLPAWRPRADMLHLLMDRSEPELAALWKDILRAPDDREEDSLHQAKAIALARLEGDMTKWDDYWMDWELTKKEARRRSGSAD